MATSVVSAVIALYESIPGAAFGGTRPPIYLDEAPQTDATGAQLRAPYVILHDSGFKPDYESDESATEEGTIGFEVFAVPLGAASGVSVDSIVLGLKFGGETPAGKAGFDGCTLPLSGGFNYSMHMLRTMEKRMYAGSLDHLSRRVHKCQLFYSVLIGLSTS